MKKTLILIAAAAALALALVPAIGPAGTIVGSKHDLSGMESTTNQICIFCHTPHNASNTLAPLWNHATTTATFTMYSSGTLNATMPGTPGDNSKACLSCHDGTVAIDSYGTNVGSITIGTGYTGANPLANLGFNLSNDHPVSFVYDASLATADGQLDPPEADGKKVGRGATLLPLYGTTHTMECATCHNVHDPDNGDFLRMANAASALCLNCHIK